MSEYGWCRLCGREAYLTHEHLPPRAAGNRSSGWEYSIYSWLQNEAPLDGELRGGRHYQGGAKRPTLCRACNSFLGRQYVRSYADVCLKTYAALEHVYGSVGPEAIGEDDGLRLTLDNVYPGRFVRQVLAMFLSLAPGPGFRQRQRKLVHIVQTPETQIDIHPIQIMTRLFAGPKTRTSGVMAIAHLESGTASAVMEVAFPPFSFLLVLDGPAIKDAANIAPWTSYPSSYRGRLDFELPVGFGWTPFPADYRSRERVLAEAGTSLGADQPSD